MQTMQPPTSSPFPTPSPIPTPETSRENGYSPGIHYLQGGIPIAVPPGGMVETFDHGEGYDDECAAPTVSLDIDTSYPEEIAEALKEKEQEGQVEDLLGLARVWEERIDRFLAREFGSGGEGESGAAEILRDVQKQTRISLGVVEEALNRWRFDEIAMSFNGGKDCLVMLIVFLAAVSRWYRNHKQQTSSTSTTSTSSATSSSNSDSSTNTTTNSLCRLPKIPTAIPCVYVMSSHPFPEVDSFVSACVHTYHLTMHRYPIPMKTAFATYLAAHPRVQTILVGTRRTDPHGSKLGHFDTTDGGWPKFVRCQPVIDWHYREIWAFLRELNVPYCNLYDLGYTSLGGTTDTKPNPKLALDKEVNGVGFRPAYELMNDDEERLGRDR